MPRIPKRQEGVVKSDEWFPRSFLRKSKRLELVWICIVEWIGVYGMHWHFHSCTTRDLLVVYNDASMRGYLVYDEPIDIRFEMVRYTCLGKA
jgi:hypothetical protein